MITTTPWRHCFHNSLTLGYIRLNSVVSRPTFTQASTQPSISAVLLACHRRPVLCKTFARCSLLFPVAGLVSSALVSSDALHGSVSVVVAVTSRHSWSRQGHSSPASRWGAAAGTGTGLWTICWSALIA
jgi:hypothetical protein